ncbi:MAG: PepSY domain-containing protein, partial [Planctomycetes bacterium]|nr:PepSY domain-containing protein [Planctomycetota bacterium]
IDGSAARLSERRPRTSRASSFPRETFAAERAEVERAAAATLAAAGMRPENLRVIGGPSLRVTAGDTRWSTTLTHDRVSESTVGAFDIGRLMRRLHVTHGYGRPDWPRIVWAVFVDIMAFAMVMWSVTGVVMWWQKKSLRVPGGITIAGAFGGGVALIVALQTVFSS